MQIRATHVWTLVLCAILCALSFSSCESPELKLLDDKVLVDELYVPKTDPPIPAIRLELPVRDAAGGLTGRHYVIAPEDSIPPGTPRLKPSELDVDDQSVEWWNGFRTGTPLDPLIPIGGYMLSKFLLSRRSRKLVAQSVKSATKLDLKGAFANLAKADGWAHSRPEEAPVPAPTPENPFPGVDLPQR